MSPMSPSRRTSLDIPGTNWRRVDAVRIGLGCGRRALMALGEVGCGLMGVEFVHGVRPHGSIRGGCNERS